jgi:hypothetical protein
MKIIKLFPGFISIIFFSFLSVYCTAPTSITTWKDPSFKSTFKKVLVVALVKDLEFRKAYEENLAYDLTREGIFSTTSLDLLSYSNKISKKELEQVLKDGKYDGLLAVKYKGTKTSKIYYPSYSYYDYYNSWSNDVSAPGYVENYKTVLVETTLFSVQMNKAVWVGSAKTYDARSAGELAYSLSAEVIAGLIDDNMIK